MFFSFPSVPVHDTKHVQINYERKFHNCHSLPNESLGFSMYKFFERKLIKSKIININTVKSLILVVDVRRLAVERILREVQSAHDEIKAVRKDVGRRRQISSVVEV
jgi:hypothetical protein